MRILVTLFVLTLLACPPPGPPTPPPAPDATDASPVLGDGSPLPPETPCQAACDAMGRVCGKAAVLPDCVRTLAAVESGRIIREPGTGKPQTCADVAAASDTVQMRAVGVKCGN
jgi:hypothetical protein